MRESVIEVKAPHELELRRLTARLTQALAQQQQLLAQLDVAFATVSDLSHSINNPLTTLLGRAQMLQSQQGLEPAVAKNAALITEASRRVAEHVRELSRFVHAGRKRCLDLQDEIEKSRV